MKLKNLEIKDSNINNKKEVIDAIHELDNVISDNYLDSLDREIGIEFNIGSRLGEPKEYLVIYANPKYKNNPYIFVLKQIDSERELVNNTTLESFRDLEDIYIRQEVNKTIAVGFKNLPKHAFLSLAQIQTARDLAEEYDDITL